MVNMWLECKKKSLIFTDEKISSINQYHKLEQHVTKLTVSSRCIMRCNLDFNIKSKLSICQKVN